MARLGRRIVVIGLVLSIVGVVATGIVAGLVPGDAVGWAIALPQLVAGAGSGLVISPNQTLTLAEVPVAGGGSAAAVVQTGQRIGTAIGIAAIGAVFFSALAAGVDYVSALATSMYVVAGCMTVALVIALTDLWVGAHQPGRVTAPAPPG